MNWELILYIFTVAGLAVWFLYRTVRKGKWCPDIYGSGGSCAMKPEEKSLTEKKDDHHERSD